MWIVLLCIIAVMIAVAIFFRIPYSPTASQFQSLISERMQEVGPISGVFEEADIAGLPGPVQWYFRTCGYLGTPKMTSMRASLNNVDFVMSEDRTIKINYQQFNLVNRPERYALISSSLYGIPFEGLDSYQNGEGSMKGTLAKVIPLFDQVGEKMNRACLVTWLAECLMEPSAALQEFVVWEAIDDTHAKATVSWKGVKTGGVFAFSETGELLSFRTGDRTAIDMKGKETKAEWSAFFLAYHSVNGILQPGVIQSVWHYPEGDCIYFNENKSMIAIRYQ